MATNKMIQCPECDSFTIPVVVGDHMCSECNTKITVNGDSTVTYMAANPESLEKANKFWRSGVSTNPNRRKHYRAGNYPESPLMRLFGIDAAVASTRKPGYLYCCECGKEVAHAIATIGKKPSFRRVEKMVGVNPLEFEESIYVSQKKSVYCPDCVGKIKPILNKDGSLKDSGVVFERNGEYGALRD